MKLNMAELDVCICMTCEPYENCHTLLHAHDLCLKRLSEIRPAYDVLQSPLFLWNGQDGYKFNIPQIETATGEPITSEKKVVK